MNDTTRGDRPAPLLASDAWRNVISLGVTTVVTFILFVIYNVVVRHVGFTLNVIVLVGFVFWTCYALSYLVLTVTTFSRADQTELASWLGATMTRRALARGEESLRGAGPTVSVQWSVLAIVSVVLVAQSPTLLDDPLANALSFAVVASAWLVTVVAYAVHYSRHDLGRDGLLFPGKDDGVTFWDYLYLSGQVSATFSTGDVTVTSTRARRVVLGHSLIAFLFNTVIIALLITILFLTN